MQILVFVFHFPPISGGGSVVSFDIINTFANLGHEVTVLVPDVNWSGKKYEPLMNPRVKIIRVKTPSRNNLKLAARRCQSNLRKKGEEIGRINKFDFIFSIFHPFHLVPNSAVLCAKTLKIPVIVKVDDAIYEKSSGLKSIQRKIEKIYNSKSLCNATKILVPNEETRNLVSNFYKIPLEKISILPNGINLSIFKMKSSAKEKKIIFLGMMYYHRGLDILLDAAVKVISKLPTTKFVLLGEGPEMEKLQVEVTRKNLSSNVEFKGWIDRENIPAYLSESSIGIGPLRLTDVTKNALPIKVLEYMASSLPIIAAKETLPTDILMDGYNGYFIENSDELAEKIIFLLQNEDTRKLMGERSAEVVKKFDWNNIIQIILDEYQKIRSSNYF
jgi:glycosyltransferase involved in cell wall biosynthesis